MSSALHTGEYEVFRALLAQARLAAGLTQVEVAQHLGKPQSYVSKYENGERRLDVPEFLQLADVLGLDVAAFLEEYRAAVAMRRNVRRNGR